MAEGAPIESGRDRIILVGQDGQPVRLDADNGNGRVLLDGVGMTLRAAIGGGMIRVTPYGALPLEPIVSQSVAPSIQTVGRTLELVAAEYKKDSSNPDLLGEFNQAFWDVQRQAMGVSTADLAVPDAPYTQKQIEQFRKTDFGIFVPEIVSRAPEGLMLLGKAFPRMGSWAFQAGTTVLNVDKAGNPIGLFGWMNTEKAINAPNTRTTQQSAEDILKEKGRIGLTLNVYTVAGQQSKLLTGQFLDKGSTWSRVLSSRSRGRVLDAYFDGGGSCDVDSDLEPGSVGGSLGARSVEVARA